MPSCQLPLSSSLSTRACIGSKTSPGSAHPGSRGWGLQTTCAAAAGTAHSLPGISATFSCTTGGKCWYVLTESSILEQKVAFACYQLVTAAWAATGAEEGAQPTQGPLNPIHEYFVLGRRGGPGPESCPWESTRTASSTNSGGKSWLLVTAVRCIRALKHPFLAPSFVVHCFPIHKSIFRPLASCEQ